MMRFLSAGNIILVISAFLAVAVLFPLAEARREGSPLKRWLPAVFGAPEEGPGPSETLVAPFGVAGMAAIDVANAALPVNAAAMDHPHRTAEEVGKWTANMISESLTMGTADHEERLRMAVRTMTPEASEAYRSFLEGQGILENIRRGYALRAFVGESPFVLSRGVAGDHYAWLFEIPVMMTYLPDGVNSYEGVTPVNEEIMIRVQVGRSHEAVDEEGVLIESWSVIF